MSTKPDGTNGKKQTKASVYKTKSENPMKREARKAAIKAQRMRVGEATARGTARAKRRYAGNYAPVNTEASLAQAPYGRYALSQTKPKSKAVKDIEAILAVKDIEAILAVV